jgi:hypothetical protein
MEPNYKIEVSTDQKIYLELGQLEEKLQRNKMEMKQLKKNSTKLKVL